ncbi:hypothetical protein EV644_12960 [Kribbella orskensis]|uniref:DUF2188 domain-containing protein n=1 Tax=Kribbella orskensis TaxID=2512216 RepID=A0ABY2B8K7_9ACTN|nr:MULTISPECIES: hypothetical protein [Kribbella]TCN31185.1 hypothetical protein EV642_13160 [Kribbella sp. VKM Ac-2500]TCO11691.1 hypothetical protein EV644_12960 [Kribbella orskensis]
MTTRTDNASDTAVELHADVETYYDNGTWHTRRCDSAEPFASGASRVRLIAIGVEVARWNGLRHIIRDTDGNIVEVNRYVTGPYPSRSPVTRERIGR